MDSKGILPKITLENKHKGYILPTANHSKTARMFTYKKNAQRTFTAPSLMVVVLGKTMAKES